MYAIELQNLKKAFGSNVILREIDLKVEKNAIVNISGPSGAGKTTLLMCIAGLEKIDAGLIRLNDATVQFDRVFIPPNKRNLSMVFQNQALWPHMTVYENIDFAAKGLLKSKTERTEWIHSILDKMKITHKQHELPGNLSGGEQQRVALARALANRPKILLLDEPFNHLDNELRERFREELKQIHRDFDMTTVIVSHQHEHLNGFVSGSKVLENGILHDG